MHSIWRERFADARRHEGVEERLGGGGGKTIADVLVEHYSATGPEPKSGTRGLQMADHGDDTDAFVDFVLKEMESTGAGVPGASSRGLKGLGSSLNNAAGAIGNYLASGRSMFSRYFTWGELLTNYREAIIETYYSLYDPQHTRLILTAPAIVDYNYWLQDYSPSSLKDQVELLSVSVVAPAPADARLRGLRSAAGGQAHAESAIGARHRPRGGDETRLPGSETLFADGLQAHG